jgi:hypothetical protein
MATKPMKFWCGTIPDIHGYGLMVFERTEAEARKTLKREFRKMQKAWNGVYTFPEAFENFGGRIFELETGKSYDDSLS